MIPETTSKLKVVRLTPPGRGGVASLLLAGTGAVDEFRRHWTGPAIEFGERQFFGRFQLGDGLVEAALFEEVVVFAPHADEIELHCHGGEAVVAALESVFVRSGAAAVDWRDFFCPNDSQRELAQRFLPLATTERTALILLDQFNGALERELAELETAADTEEIRRRRERLTENARLARHLIEPFRIVLAGPVNAGKSSLLNALLGFGRAVVDPTPGTTRDTVSGRTAVDGFPVELVDTAGFRETDNELERQGIERSKRMLDRADLVLWVVDVTAFEAAAVPERENLVVCLNKIDLLDGERVGRLKRTRKASVSAMTGDGIEALLERIIRILVPNPPEPLEAVPLAELAKIRAE